MNIYKRRTQNTGIHVFLQEIGIALKCKCQQISRAGMAGFPQALAIMETLEIHEKKVPCMENSWN